MVLVRIINFGGGGESEINWRMKIRVREREEGEKETWSLEESSLVCKTLASFERAYARVASN